jgi:thiosulfate/3-mercaptopyruvate sulfurtransferase
MRLPFIPSAALALALAGAALPAAAGSPRDTLVVSTAWLAQHLQDPDLVLLHVGDKSEYAAAHIPGARLVEMREISVSDPQGAGNGLTLEMPPAEVLREKLAALGISDRSRIVVYFGKDWLSPSTRVIFTLDYAGLGERVSLLDGGQPAWVRDGGAVTAEIPEVRAGTLSPLKIRETVVNAAFLREHGKDPGLAIVDARDVTFYDGTKSGGRRPDAPKFGHIPGAVSLPFSETADDLVRLRSADDLQARFAAAGIKPGGTIVAYCHIGQQATAVIFAARTLGIKALLYDGSFEDWTKNAEAPLVNPAAAKAPAKEPSSSPLS